MEVGVRYGFYGNIFPPQTLLEALFSRLAASSRLTASSRLAAPSRLAAFEHCCGIEAWKSPSWQIMNDEAELKRIVKLRTKSGVERYRPSSHLINLAVPKQSKAIWWTSFEPNLVWGNQEPMWPLNPAALQATATPRTMELATPKKDKRNPELNVPEYEHGCGRPSQIWTVSPHAIKAMATMRTKELARHKSVAAGFIHHRPQHMYSCGRCSTIWQTSRPAMTCPNRPHTARLAQPKQLHTDYLSSRQVRSVITDGAMAYMVTPHIESLAKPKEKLDGPFRDPQWTVSSGAKEAIPNDRILDLAKSKKLADGYQPCRSVIWKVGVGALNAVTSNRMEELAKPIIKVTMDHVQFDPDAFNVSKAATKAKASARIEELAEPIKR